MRERYCGPADDRPRARSEITKQQLLFVEAGQRKHGCHSNILSSSAINMTDAWRVLQLYSILVEHKDTIKRNIAECEEQMDSEKQRVFQYVLDMLNESAEREGIKIGGE